MNKLDLIWELEECTSSLEANKKNLDMELKCQESEKNKQEMEKIIARLEVLEEELLDSEAKIRKEETKLVDLQYEINKIDEDLYSGSVVDLKQLEYLSKEKQELLKDKSLLESKTLMLMEDEEIITLENIRLKIKLNTLKKLVAEIKKDHDIKLKEIEESILKEKELIENLNKNIEDEVLDIYYDIKKRKTPAISLVKDSICTGCNMRIPTYLLGSIKGNNELIHCEYCGRILYYKKNKE